MKRYKEIIPNYEDFEEIIEKQQPYDIRVNTIKSTISEVENFLETEGMNFAQRDWNKNFLKINSNPSKTLFHWLGKYYIQESVSGIPPLVLKPGPDDRVLDMCAAPGSKTTQLAAIMDNRGDILANDRRANRTRSLLSNLYKTGVINTIVTERDGRNLPESPKFDKILLDVPCSNEGNLRSSGKKKANMKRIRDLSGLQEKLLDKAFRMCADGGVIVYSTCTFAPEENEMVVSKFKDRGELQEITLDFSHSNGITEWNGENLGNNLEKCVRVYPHQLDSGGIFVAKFEK